MDAITIVFVVSALAFVGEALLFVATAYMNRDEGWYVLSGRLVLAGRVPYRDFPYFQAPLVPYVFALPQLLFGSTLLVGRVLAAALGAVAIGIVAHLARRLGGREAAAVALVLLLVTPDYLLATTTARSEALVIPLVLAALLVALRWPDGFVGFAVPPLLLLLASAARLTCLPAFVLAVGYCYWRARPSRRELVAGAALLAAGAVALSAPFLLLDWRHTLFDVWGAQAARNGQFQLEPRNLATQVVSRIWFAKLAATSFFVVIVPMVVLAAVAWERWRQGWRPSRPGLHGDRLSNYLLMTVFALLLWLPFAPFDHQESRYFIPSFAVLSIVVADGAIRASRGAFGEVARFLPPLFAALLAAHVLFQLPVALELLDARHPQLQETGQAGAYIRSLVPEGERFLTLNPTLAVAAGRDVPPPLEMGQFAYWPALDSDAARRRDVVNRALLSKMMRDPSLRVIAFEDYDLNLIWDTSSDVPEAPADTEWPFQVFPQLRRDFELVRKFERFGQFRGTLYVLVRKP